MCDISDQKVSYTPNIEVLLSTDSVFPVKII